jgi:DNA segregation ATPase FtsK/SpoIIIE, S-DNA-T family
MTTWGPSKKTPSNRARSSGAPASRTSRTTAANRSGVRDATPPSTSRNRRTRAQDDLRGAVEGREHEFVGIGLIGGGVLLGLGMYWNLAGPVGRGIEKLFGWITGIGRFVLPLLLIAVGIALVHKGRSSNPFRLVLGWGLMALSALGFLHLVRGPDKIWAGFDELGTSGGWLGAVVAEPLRAMLASGGAVVVLLAAFVGGLLLVTSTSLRTMATQTGRGVGSVARPLGRAARKAITDLSTLSSDKADRAAGRDGSNVAGEASALAPPNLYDLAAEDGDPWAPPSTAAKPRKRRGRAGSVPGATGQPQLPLEGTQVGEWTLPPLSYLTRPTEQAINRPEIERRGQTLQEALEQHGVDTVLLGMTVGPTVTRYELELGPGVKVARVTTLQKDIAYAMAATDVRILAPIPGRSAIGVEVPNHQRQLVALGDLLAAPEAKTSIDPLDVAIGKDIAGRAVFLDLATTPHLLIAGATGAGKSSGLNCIITSLLMRSTPDQVRLILIDPKQVEMGQYQRLPHLLTQPVTNPKKAANALAWAVKEMDRRYDILSEVGFRDITGYNAAFDRGEVEAEPHRDAQYERLPFIVIVVDELNDLMMVAARDVEDSITRIAQKARAVGIHLIVATQRPSVNVITGVIKANIPARAAFAVSSLTDSRVILDQSGAEKLCGQGDMLLLPGNSSVAQRIQGAFVSEQEVRKVVAHWRRQAPDVSYVNDVEGGTGSHGDDMVTSSDNAFSSGQDDDDTVMLRQAMELVVRSQLGSTSMLQRKLKVGFARAGRIMDLLEQRGVVGPSEGSKAREVLMTVEEFELLREAGER